MNDDDTKKLTEDEKAALRVEAAREFLKCLEPLGEGNEHNKLRAAFACLLLESGPPYDYAAAAFSKVASLCVRDEGRRVDVHMLAEGRVDIHGGDGSLESFVEQPEDDIEPAPEPTLQ